jgi:hypothetical protein
MQRGVTRTEWAAFIDEPGSKLGTQAKLKRGTKPRTRAEYVKTLDRAWTKAATWLADRPAAFGPVEILQRIRDVRERVEHPDADLTDVERRILIYACQIGAEKMTDRPALPRHAVVAATGLGERTVRNALERMSDAGLLRLEVRGLKDPARRRAGLYRLPGVDHIPIPASGSTGPPAQIYRPPADDLVGTPEQIYGTPDGVVTLTLTGDPDAVLRTVRNLTSNQDIDVEVRGVKSLTPRTGSVNHPGIRGGASAPPRSVIRRTAGVVDIDPERRRRRPA